MTRRTYVKITPCSNQHGAVLDVSLDFVRNNRSITRKVINRPTYQQLEALRADAAQWALIGKVDLIDMTDPAQRGNNNLKFAGSAKA
jgi:hypothetical protein